ncbi:MAG TPA: extracellular solute-binding protein [Chloroflexota bacterium]|nr:extracellular solute-binding protein [Chloroflexota bacterium]
MQMRSRGWHVAPRRRGATGGLATRRGLALRAATLAGAGGLAPVLARCGPWPAPAPVKGGGEVRFLHWIPDWVDKLQPQLQQYQERTGTRITVEPTDLGAYPTKVTAAFAADAAPDVLFSYSQNDSKYYDAGAVLDLSERWKRDRFNLGDYALMGTERWCAKGYGMPFFAEPFGMYYNKTLLRQSGLPDPWDAPLNGDWTWDDLAQMARRVSRPKQGDEPSGVYGLYWPYDNVTYFGPNVWSFGGDHVDFERMRWALDSPVALEAFQRFSRWLRTERTAIAVGGAEWQALAQAYPGKNPFQAGRAAFWYRSVTEIGWNQQRIGSDFEWDLLPVPRQGSQAGVSMTAGHPHIIWARSRYPDQAYDLTRYLAGPEVQEFTGRARISLPALKAKFDSFLSPPPVPHVHVLPDIYKRPRGIHFRHHNTPENWAQYGQAITPLLLGDQPLVEGLRELNRQMNDRVEYGGCAPYKGLKHPLPPGA